MDMIQGRMDLAVKYGADVAIFVHNVVYWVEKNAANRVNFHDGRYWTYNSAEALGEMYPLWSRDQIKRLIKRCSDLGLLILGDYNSDRRDRTKWYTPSDEILELYGLGRFALCIGRNRPMHSADSPDASGEIAPPLPSIDQVDTTVPPYSPPTGDKPGPKEQEPRTSKYDLQEDAKPLLNQYVGNDAGLAKKLLEYIEIRRKKRAVNSKTAIKILLKRLDEYSGGDRNLKMRLLDNAIVGSWLSIYPLKFQGRDSPPRPSPAQLPKRSFHKEIIDGEEVFVYDDEPS